VNQVAADFADSKYVELAKDFRMPYWDFCTAGQKTNGFLPDQVMSKSIPDVTRPDGTKLTSNPLFNYEYGEVATSNDAIVKNGAVSASFALRQKDGLSLSTAQAQLFRCWRLYRWSVLKDSFSVLCPSRVYVFLAIIVFPV
jgi:hypothetical protein